MRDPNRQFDQTQLRSNHYQKLVHRDYAAHFFRWGFVKRLVKPTDEVLDVGCGQDVMLVALIGQFQSLIPKRYVGVDLNTFKPPQRTWATFYPGFDFTSRYKELGGPSFTMAVCLEVIEHMRPTDGAKLLRGIHWCLKPGGQLLLSTPVYDGVHHAKNHLHEYRVPELQRVIEKAGFTVIKRYGTFMNYHELKKVAPPEQVKLVNELRKFYDDDVSACFLAPLYPDHARNNLWVCEKP